MESKKLYKPFLSTAKNKKYSVYVLKDNKKRLVHFGDSRYGQYFDKIGNFKKLDHKDEKRKKAYYARHGATTNKNTAKFWSHKILW